MVNTHQAVPFVLKYSHPRPLLNQPPLRRSSGFLYS